jgi:hypothetical protein
MKTCGRCWPMGDGPGYMTMCPCNGFIDVGHGGGPRPSLVVAPWETTVVLRCCHRGFHHCRCSCRHYRCCGDCYSYAGCCCCHYCCRGRCRCSCQASEAATVERTTFCWSRTPSEQQLDRRCPGGFPPSWYSPGCGGWRRWCRCTMKKRSRSPWSRKTWIRGPASWRRPAPYQGADGRPGHDDARWRPSPRQFQQR